MKITLLGTGTSQGVPVIACKCNICTSCNPKDLRTTDNIACEVLKELIKKAPTEIQQQMKDNIKWIEKDSTYTLINYKKRYILSDRDSIKSGIKLDTTFNFMPHDLVNIDYMAKEMNSIKLNQYIKQSRERGVGNLNTYLVEFHKRTSLPISSYILTFLAVSLASKKRRGGMGVNLAIGITLMFLYVFFLKIAEVLGAGADTNSFFMVWFPNIFFGCIATYLYFDNAKN